VARLSGAIRLGLLLLIGGLLFAVPSMAAAADEAAKFRRNDLAGATSPFLQQHTDNPIHWQRWDDAVLAYAKRAGKPIFLSVGYSSCYWCHVMERESFEDDVIAGYLNEHFVSILVDREERPDIDYLYQNALYAMTGGGGWPLNMFLDTDGTPFWGGTYFPNVERHGMKPFGVLLELVNKSWIEDRAQITSIGEQVRASFAREADRPGVVTPGLVAKSAAELLDQVDAFYGGFGDAPKYPQPQNLEVLWRAYLRSAKPAYGDAVRRSLRAMVQGGLNDHLRGGFARYAVDPDWRQPHFEKMLYTNAGLIRLMTWVWQEDGAEALLDAVQTTVKFVLERMGTPGGAFGSSFDAETEEGRYYLWTAAEIDQLLGARGAMFKAAYEVSEEGTFKPEADWLASAYHGRASVLFRGDKTTAELARIGGIAAPDVEAALSVARNILQAHREAQRPPPPFDDKILSDWNGLTIRALAEAGFAMSQPDWVGAAEKAYGYVRDHHGRRDAQGYARLYHASRKGRAYGDGFVEDYAQMTLAALALFEATGRSSYRDDAAAWTKTALKYYGDADKGGFFQTADDQPGLVIRTKADFDGELPAGNGAMVEALARLYFLIGDPALSAQGEAAMKAQGGAVAEAYFSLATLLNAADTLFRGVQIVLIGARGEADTDELLRAVARLSLPGRVLQVISPGATLPEGHPAQYKIRIDDKATVYVCVGQICSLPVTTATELHETVKLMQRSQN